MIAMIPANINSITKGKQLNVEHLVELGYNFFLDIGDGESIYGDAERFRNFLYRDEQQPVGFLYYDVRNCQVYDLFPLVLSDFKVVGVPLGEDKGNRSIYISHLNAGNVHYFWFNAFVVPLHKYLYRVCYNVAKILGTCGVGGCILSPVFLLASDFEGVGRQQYLAMVNAYLERMARIQFELPFCHNPDMTT